MPRSKLAVSVIVAKLTKCALIPQHLSGDKPQLFFFFSLAIDSKWPSRANQEHYTSQSYRLQRQVSVRHDPFLPERNRVLTICAIGQSYPVCSASLICLYPEARQRREMLPRLSLAAQTNTKLSLHRQPNPIQCVRIT